MKFYWGPQTRAFRIAWLLEESGLSYERVTIDIRDAEARNNPGFRKVSPMGKVPALEDGPARLWDSGAIAIYLADAYPDCGLGVPVGDPQRAALLQWTTYLNSVIEPAMIEQFMGTPANPRRSGYGSFELMVSSLETALAQGPWILGDRFTVADPLIGSGLHVMQVFGALDAPPPACAAYLERCRARPAFERAMAMDAPFA